jgi:hypothetical protein
MPVGAGLFTRFFRHESLSGAKNANLKAHPRGSRGVFTVHLDRAGTKGKPCMFTKFSGTGASSPYRILSALTLTPLSFFPSSLVPSAERKSMSTCLPSPHFTM